MDLEFQQIVQCHRARYPRMTPQDWAKLAYQSAFGPEHMLSDPDGACAGLLAEWSAIPQDAAPQLPEPIGNGLSRFHLDRRYDPEEAAPLLAELFCRTGRAHTGTQQGLAEKLALLEEMDQPGMKPWLTDWRRQGCPSVHHSQTFRQAYQPHYRVVRADYANAFPALLAVKRLVQTGKPALVAIDGRCGSGKTGLAALLERLFPCNVLHADDFYLPPAQRPANWEQLPGGNMDLSRLREEAVLPALEGREILYRPYSCPAGAMGQTVAMPPKPLTVLEGSYSHHPDIAVAYSLRIFLTCTPEVQRQRLQQREGEHFAAFEARWIPMEERYLAQCGVQRQADLLLDTSAFF